MTPRVRPARPRAFPYIDLFQTPARRSFVWSTIRRSRARTSPHASSATAIAFLPGQFETAMARAEAAWRSIVFTPAPARTMSARPEPRTEGGPLELRLVEDLATEGREAVQPGLFERVCHEHFHGEPQNRLSLIHI